MKIDKQIWFAGKVLRAISPLYAAPARAEDLSNLPPAISLIGTEDPFYAETVDYFHRLKDAGIKSDLEIFEGGYHAFDMMAPYAKISKDAYSYLLNEFDKYVKEYIRENEKSN